MECLSTILSLTSRLNNIGQKSVHFYRDSLPGKDWLFLKDVIFKTKLFYGVSEVSRNVSVRVSVNCKNKHKLQIALIISHFYWPVHLQLCGAVSVYHVYHISLNLMTFYHHLLRGGRSETLPCKD